MSFVNLLTYNIKIHNYIVFTSYLPEQHPLGFWKELKRTFKRWFHKSSIRIVWNNYKQSFAMNKKPLKAVVFAPFSDNNRRALEPVWKQLNNNEYSVFDACDYLPWQLVYYYSFLYIWPLLWCYWKATKYERLLIRTYFDDFFRTMGYLVVLEQLLRYFDVRLIVMANDHDCLPRAIIYVAHKLGIKTMYLQHCSVTERFPRLSFDYNFLDGEESYLKYRTIGKPDGIVYLSGNPRFDIIKCYYKKNETEQMCAPKDIKIGIASNTLDIEDVLHNLVIKLKENGYSHITFRPHPGVNIDPSWYIEQECEYSNSNNENPFAFISRMDVVIAGECGIHLDVAMMEKRSICYNTINAKPWDWYSYIKNGLTPYAANVDELLRLLQDINKDEWKQRVRKKAQWYNAAIGTQYEGHISEMIADFIRYEHVGDVENFDRKYGFTPQFIQDFCVNVL